MNDETTIIGIGTACGGTRSLAALLQEWGLRVTHEGTPSLKWGRRAYPSGHERLLRPFGRRDGDVACWLAPAAAYLLKELSDARVLALRRRQDDTVSSLQARFSDDRIREPRLNGGRVFPTYPDATKGEAWRRYWWAYHRIVRGLVTDWPDRVLCVPLWRLESEEMQAEVAEHIAHDGWTHTRDCHKGER